MKISQTSHCLTCMLLTPKFQYNHENNNNNNQQYCETFRLYDMVIIIVFIINILKRINLTIHAYY